MSNNLNLDQVAAGQNQAEQTINDATGQLDAAVTELLEVDLSSGSETLTEAEFRSAIYFIAAGMTADRTITLPEVKRLFVVVNPSSDYWASIIQGTTTINVAPQQKLVLYTDGTANGLVIINRTYYTVDVFIAGTLGSDEILMRHIVTRPIAFAEDFPQCIAEAGVAADAETVLDVQKNGSSIGSITFAISGTDGTFSISGGATFAAGDILSIVAPNSPDANLADVSISITD